MQEAVLKPLGMHESTFAHPLPADKARITATGHFPKAAAGLWTTASDLANKGLGPFNFYKTGPAPGLRSGQRRNASPANLAPVTF